MSNFKSGLFSQCHVLVTGAGRGIGAAIAETLLADGAHVYAHLGRSENAEKWTFPAKEKPLVDSETLGSLKTYTADLGTPEGVQELLDAIGSDTDKLDVLVNNAGTMLGRVPSEQLSLQHYDSVMAINTRSVVLLTTGLLNLLKASQTGASIVNVTSISAATGGSPGSSIYSAAKGFVSTYTRSLATELAPAGIRVNAISPGTIDTDFHERYSSPAKLARTASSTPLGRLGTAADCVDPCLFLASNKLSGFITGQILGINGGTSYQG